MQSYNTKQKVLPTPQAFSNPTSVGVISSADKVSPEQLLRRGRRSDSKLRKEQRVHRARQKAADQKRGANRKSTNKITSSAHMLSPQEVRSNLESLDRKLADEQARRLELEGMLRKSPDSKTSDANTLGHTLITREQRSSPKKKGPGVRISSPGAVLRRGSQVSFAPRTSAPVTTIYNRQYRHSRDLEDDMIRTEEELTITKTELGRVTSTLMTVQTELDVRTKDLEQSRGKVDSLLSMVKHLLQHLVEKRERRRFSMQASTELQRQLAEPLSASFGQIDTKMSDYVDERMTAIDNILPQWSAVYGSGFDDSAPELYASMNDNNNSDNESEYQESSVDLNESPPPLPPTMGVSRRNVNTAAGIPLPSPPSGSPPSGKVADMLLEVWDRIDEEEDGVLSVREISTSLMRAVSGVSLDLRDSVIDTLKNGALVVHQNGNAAFEEDLFVQALEKTQCGLQLVKLMERNLEDEAKYTMPDLPISGSPSSAEKKKLRDWNRKQSEHSLPRGIHEHSR